MATISKPVGRISGAGNLPADVMAVQKLLNGVPPDLGGPKVKLVVTGKADAKTADAIVAFQKVWLPDPSQQDGRVDPKGATLDLLNMNSAENVTVDGVAATGATRTAAFGNKAIAHFVTPKAAGGTITLKATVSPGHKLAEAALVWEGATAVPGRPAEATLPAFPDRKQVVRVKRPDGKVIQEIRVWVVWCTITGAPDVKTNNGVVEAPSKDGKELELVAPWTFIHRISPPQIIIDPDRPWLDGTNPTQVPQTLRTLKGTSLRYGANFVWDASRQVRVRMLDPRGIVPRLRDSLDYPKDPVEGNDDDNTSDEDNNPYDNAHGKGVKGGKPFTFDNRDHLKSIDTPSLTLRHSWGKDGNTVERRLHFLEFTRLDLGGKWVRISDDFEWRYHIKFKKEAGKWVNDGSDTEDNNFGFDLP